MWPAALEALVKDRGTNIINNIEKNFFIIFLPFLNKLTI